MGFIVEANAKCDRNVEETNYFYHGEKELPKKALSRILEGEEKCSRTVGTV